MLKVNVGLKDGEKVLVVIDVPTVESGNKNCAKLTEAVEGSMVPKMADETATRNFRKTLSSSSLTYQFQTRNYAGKEVERENEERTSGDCDNHVFTYPH